MITHFYKILYKQKDVIYVGVTTNPIQYRFKQHILSKNLNTKDYSVIEFDTIIHPNIKSIHDYNIERKKVYNLERKYIAEEKNKGSNLLNVSAGGEWGTCILYRLLKTGLDCNTLELKYKNWKKTKSFITNWILHSTENKTKYFLHHWIENKSNNKTKCFLRNWIYHRSKNKIKPWLKHWIDHRNTNQTKKWLHCWINHRNYNKTKRWLQNWINSKSINKTKRFLRNWSHNKSIKN